MAASAASERDVATLRGAIELVRAGDAVEIILCGLDSPEAASACVAAEGAAAGVPVVIVAGAEGADVVVGPRTA